MKTIVPDYYEKFQCIAGACRHSCCIGWEIDIDEKTRSFYQSVPGTFGQRLAAHIEETNGAAHFILDDNERCPFLNAKGLCDIYTELGEAHLCQICTDHPRFRNFFQDCTEIGLGLCCEAAAKLILTKEDKTTLCVWEQDGNTDACTEEEALCLARRNALFAILQDRSKPLEQRLQQAQDNAQIFLSPCDTKAWADVFLKLEYMDNHFTELIMQLKEKNPDFYAPIQVNEIAFEQLAVYLIFRHFKDFFDIGQEELAVGFMLLSLRMLYALRCVCTDEKLEGIARLYSAEIEYSEENVEALTEYIAYA